MGSKTQPVNRKKKKEKEGLRGRWKEKRKSAVAENRNRIRLDKNTNQRIGKRADSSRPVNPEVRKGRRVETQERQEKGEAGAKNGIPFTYV